MTLSNVTSGLADSCANITAWRLERFVVVGQSGVLQRHAIVPPRFGGDDGCLVRTNLRFFVGQVGLQSEFTAIKKLVCYGNRRRLVF